MRLPYLISLIITCLLGCGLSPFAPDGANANVEIRDAKFDGDYFHVVLENTGTDKAYYEAIAYGYWVGGRILFIVEADNTSTENATFELDAGVSVVATFYLRPHKDTYPYLRSIKIEVSWKNGKTPNEKTFRFG